MLEVQKQIKVSVVIPVYNVDLYLRTCLDSIVHQSLEEIEIICIDDGSTDDSCAILEEYAKKDSRFHIITLEHQGVSEARNTGIKRVTGEYIYFQDSDDWLDEQALERLYHVSKEKDLDVLYFSSQQHDEFNFQDDLGYFTRIESHEKAVWKGLDLLEFCMQTNTYYPNIWCQFYKTSFIFEEQMKFVHDSVYDDCAFSFEIILKAKRAYAIADSFYHYRLRSNSIVTSRATHHNVESYLTVWMNSLLVVKSLKLSPKPLSIARDYLDYLRKLAYQEYRKVYDNHQRDFNDLFYQLERIYFGESFQEETNSVAFLQQRSDYPELCFFGAGEECIRMLHFFKDNQLLFPVAICDNAKSKQGTTLEGVPVMSFPEACEKYPNMRVIVTSIRVYHPLKAQAETVLGIDRVIPFEI